MRKVEFFFAYGKRKRQKLSYICYCMHCKLILMKTIWIFLFTAIFSGSYAQERKQLSEPQYIIVQYTTGEAWNHKKPAHEQAFFREHSQHLSELRKKQIILIGGRFSDTGMLILKADHVTTAAELINADAAIIHKTFKAEIAPFDPFYGGCVQ